MNRKNRISITFGILLIITMLGAACAQPPGTETSTEPIQS
jgi:hypothetical protein